MVIDPNTDEGGLDHETEARFKLAEERGGIDLSWCREHLASFKTMEAKAKYLKKESEMYHQQPGYRPERV